MKGLIGFCFGLLYFAYFALATTVSYFCFSVKVYLGIISVAVFVVVCVVITLSIKRKFDYYKSLADKQDE